MLLLLYGFSKENKRLWPHPVCDATSKKLPKCNDLKPPALLFKCTLRICGDRTRNFQRTSSAHATARSMCAVPSQIQAVSTPSALFLSSHLTNVGLACRGAYPIEIFKKSTWGGKPSSIQLLPFSRRLFRRIRVTQCLPPECPLLSHTEPGKTPTNMSLCSSWTPITCLQRGIFLCEA